MDSTQTQVIVSISGHWLFGNMMTKGLRVQDVLCDKNHSLITLCDVRVCQPADSESGGDIIQQAVIDRREAEFVIISGSRHETPLKRRDNFKPSETAACQLTIGRWSVEGNVHVPRAHCDGAATFLHQLAEFFPVTKVRISRVGRDTVRAPVLFAHKRHVGSFRVRPPLIAQ